MSEHFGSLALPVGEFLVRARELRGIPRRRHPCQTEGRAASTDPGRMAVIAAAVIV